MFHLLLAFLLGSASSAIAIFISRKRLVRVGDEMHLSLDAFDLELIKAGKVCNARLSTIKALADKAYGETGLSVIIHEKW